MTWVCKKITGQLAECSYNMNIPDLMFETNYEYRAYYVIDDERYYGNILTGRTSYELTKPVVETGTLPSQVTCNKASVCGKIIDNGNSSISQYGILYKKGSCVDIDFPDDTSTTPKSGVFIKEGLNPTNVSINTNLPFNISNLSPETKYYYRFFARNSCGYTNGNIRDFTTLKHEIPLRPIRLVKVGNGAANVDQHYRVSNASYTTEGGNVWAARPGTTVELRAMDNIHGGGYFIKWIYPVGHTYSFDYTADFTVPDGLGEIRIEVEFSDMAQ